MESITQYIHSELELFEVTILHDILTALAMGYSLLKGRICNCFEYCNAKYCTNINSTMVHYGTIPSHLHLKMHLSKLHWLHAVKNKTKTKKLVY